MRKYKESTYIAVHKECQLIQCNGCGKTLDGDMPEMGDITDIQISFGYGSRFDMETWSFDLCDDCAEKIINNFEILPEIME